ncbi:MAG: methylmalonate-semialdehyde dehydrogenase (CoA acylating) [Gemmatimonadales bacterium]|nr:MAG: methylmalonate-semialdehyde dehydrogenase (CoA acylating) [Gemmatimonadales bacterium]
MSTTQPATAIPNFIGGSWTRSQASECLEVRNPATAELLGYTPLSGAEDVDRAVRAAREAFPDWRSTPAIERARVLFRLKALLEREKPELAKSLTREHGKTLSESLGEIQRGIENVEHACGIPTLMMGDTLEDIAPGIDCETIRQPLGVFAVITPYNFPVMIPLWFWPYAVATGNTVVLKPSEQDPLTHQLVVELAVEAGLPPGVLNVVHGAREAVSAILEHPDIKGVSFVGSSETARFIYAKAAGHGKRVQALGGAKNHIIVLPDADLDLTTNAVVSSLFGSAGQRCLAGSVVVGVGEAYRPMRERLLDAASSLRLGYGLEEDADMGPVISRRHRERVIGYIHAGEQEGARLLLDGRGARVERYPEGNWIGPTVFEDVTPEMTIGREEIFGPVAGIARAPSLEAALSLVHRNRYGNAVSLFTTSGKAAREFRYRAGISMIGINIGVVAPMAFFPFGGSRGSFYGDLKAQGKDAIEFYTDKRVVISRW